MSSLIRKVISIAKVPGTNDPYSQAVSQQDHLYFRTARPGPFKWTAYPGGVAEEVKHPLSNIGESLKAAGCNFTSDFKSNFPARAAFRVSA
ncbi:Ribonuclease UK114 [Heterocephalus glaber]|uniref:Ribonuclease UK114 n=1 Tax=Heterocephalus glaber TaxID=10181 RepID=G5AL28_HETGA|nr:Ribonuclease UK114 [Heterocephalus glaber]